VKKKKMIISQETMDVDFVRKVEALSGTSVRRCFQCGKCSAGCPMATFMEHPPNRVVRLLQLGQWQRVLAGRPRPHYQEFAYGPPSNPCSL
jgi:heterodisulfide reductase subunit C